MSTTEAGKMTDSTSTLHHAFYGHEPVPSFGRGLRPEHAAGLHSAQAGRAPPMLFRANAYALGGWVRRWYRCHPLPAELGVRLTPHPAQAARRKCQVADSTPGDRGSRGTFTRVGSERFLWMSARLLVVATSHPATSAPCRGGYCPIRRVMASPCLSAAGLRFVAVLCPLWSCPALTIG
jgi:hypothetical protein